VLRLLLLFSDAVSTGTMASVTAWLISMHHFVEWEFAGETEVLGQNLPQCHFVHHKSHMTWDQTRTTVMGSRRLTAWAVERPCSDLCMYQGALDHCSCSGQNIKWKRDAVTCLKYSGNLLLRDHGSRVLCPEFHCVVMPCDYRLVALLFTNSSPTCLHVISFKFTSHHSTTFLLGIHSITTHTHTRILVNHNESRVRHFSYIGHDVTSSNSELNSVFYPVIVRKRL
jgi:hypothetical protein